MYFSLCGPTADERGPGQRVVTFSLSGDTIDSGAIGTKVREVLEAYHADYVVRIYHDRDWTIDPQQVRKNPRQDARIQKRATLVE